MTREISGKVRYMDFEGGFWGIESETEKFMPVNMPEQLKSPGVDVECTIRILDDQASFQNWGRLCRILVFTTPDV